MDALSAGVPGHAWACGGLRNVLVLRSKASFVRPLVLLLFLGWIFAVWATLLVLARVSIVSDFCREFLRHVCGWVARFSSGFLVQVYSVGSGEAPLALLGC